MDFSNGKPLSISDAAMAPAKSLDSEYAVFTYDDLLIDFLEDGGVV